MFLKEILEGADAWYLRGTKETMIAGITADSRCVTPGMAFFCLKGTAHDGADHAGEATERGASALIFEAEGGEGLWKERGQSYEAFEAGLGVRARNILASAPGGVTVVCVEDARKAFALACDAWYGHPSRELVTIGVTGTKGKTTTTYLIKSILENAGRRVGLIGTNEVIVGLKHYEAGNTTPDALQLQAYLRQMADAGADTVVMEVSSQAIKLKRTDGILFDYGIFTNLSPDHVAPGEHRDFQEYLECKRELFRRCRIGIVNGDDPYLERITEGHSCLLETYGLGEECMLRAGNVSRIMEDGKPGVRFSVTGQMEFEARIPMPGMFSVYNALAAISLCRHFHVRESDIQRSLLAAKVKGRVELAMARDGYAIYIDYAHNPAALASLLDTLREYRPRRLICVFGCGGDRPVMRRRLMGRISGEKADLTIVTDDNPRSEDPEVIREQVVWGVREAEGAFVIIPGRLEAIRYALSAARSGDMIVLAGKGHETYQEIQGVKYPLDERTILRELEKETCNTQTS